MKTYYVLTSDSKESKVLADEVRITDGALCFDVKTEIAINSARWDLVIAYSPGAWKFFGLMDESGDIPNLEA